jgi:hypothetical protein
LECKTAKKKGRGTVTGAIVGAHNAHQAEGVMRAGELRLADKAGHQIEHFASPERAA